MGKFLGTVFGALIVVFFVGGVIALVGWLFQLGWGWVIVPIFNASPLSFWQAVGLTLFLSFVGGLISK